MRSSERFSLQGRRAIVTGASRGIGAAIAAGLAEAGAEVYGLSRSGTAPDGVAPIACDLADDAAYEGISLGWPAVLSNLKSLLEQGHALPQAPWEMLRSAT